MRSVVEGMHPQPDTPSLAVTFILRLCLSLAVAAATLRNLT